jgi:hypothetical protein
VNTTRELSVVASIWLIVSSLAPTPAAGQNRYGPDAPPDLAAKSWLIEKSTLPPFNPPRTSDGRPDFQGYWTAGGSGDDIEEHGYVDSTTPPQESFLSDPPDGKIPYQPWALALRNRHRAGLNRGWPGETGEKLHVDPQVFCFTNVPRAAYRGGFQIVQTPGYFLFLLEWGQFHRVIPTDGRPHDLADEVKLWMGQSRGRWEGDTLVVDTTNFNDQTWMDASGNHHTTQLHTIERFTRTDDSHMTYEVIVDDPGVLTQPYTIRMQLHRDEGPYPQLLEYECHSYFEDDAAFRASEE